LRKPFEMSALARAIEAVMGERRRKRRARA
jgi:hypothetical protein